ncbi:MAG: hypothetical protein AB1656_24885 [Candidatus Omnitrophota bacterium]
MNNTPIQKALDAIESLPLEDQQMLVGIMNRRLIEQRRQEIAQNAEITLQAVRENRASIGFLNDIQGDLL